MRRPRSGPTQSRARRPYGMAHCCLRTNTSSAPAPVRSALVRENEQRRMRQPDIVWIRVPLWAPSFDASAKPEKQQPCGAAIVSPNALYPYLWRHDQPCGSTVRQWPPIRGFRHSRVSQRSGLNEDGRESADRRRARGGGTCLCCVVRSVIVPGAAPACGTSTEAAVGSQRRFDRRR
jgi:hypothetical protein